MKKDKVFIVVTHIKSLKPKSRTDWQVTERVEFLSNIKEKHIRTAAAIGDYINQSMFIGASKGMDDYTKFENYIRTKYKTQMEHLDSVFRPQPEPAVEETPAVEEPLAEIEITPTEVV